MNLIRYNGPNSEHLFSLMIDVPEESVRDSVYSDSTWQMIFQKYLDDFQQCGEESAIGIDNPEVLPVVNYAEHCDLRHDGSQETGWFYKDILQYDHPTGLKGIRVGDTFPLPDSIGYEIVNKQNGVAVFDGERESINNDVVVRLKLKSLPEKGETQEDIMDGILAKCNPKEDNSHSYYWHSDVYKAMQEYSQQQLSEFKKNLKKAVFQKYNSYPLVQLSGANDIKIINELIDTIKP